MKIEVEGIDNVLRNLRELEPKRWGRKVMKEVKAQQKPVRSSMKGAAPKSTGKLARSIRTKAWMKRKAGGELLINVSTGPRVYGKGRIWYAHFAENNKKTGGYIAKTRAKFANTMAKQFSKALDKVIKKANG